MELRVLRYFWTVAEVGTISAAAEELFITQPTLSRQIRDLEHELGADLFTRVKNRLELTEAGLLLKSRAAEILALAQQTEQEFSDRRHQSFKGTVHIGSVEAGSSDHVAAVIEEFIRDYPEARFSLTTGSGDIVLDRLDKGLVDVGVLLEPIDTEKYFSYRLPDTEEWGLLVASDSFLAGKDVIVPSDMEGIPLILSSRPAVEEMLMAWLGHRAENPKIVGRYNLNFNVVPLVERQIGAALSIRGVAPEGNDVRLKFVPLSPPLTTHSVVAWRKNRVMTPIAAEFIRRFEAA